MYRGKFNFIGVYMDKVINLMKNLMSERIKFIVKMFFLHLIIFLIFRIAFFLWFKPTGITIFSDSVMRAFYLGIKFDARLAALICLPLILLSKISFIDFVNKKSGKIFWMIYLLIVFAVVNVFYIFDFGMYDYLKIRLNSTIMMFADNSSTSFNMLWQSYPLVKIFGSAAIAMFLYYKFLKRIMFNGVAYNAVKHPVYKRLSKHVVFVLIFVFIIYGKFSRFPLRWNEAFFTPDAFLSNFTLNPVLFFYDTTNIKKLDYDNEKLKKGYPLLADYFDIKNNAPDAYLTLKRECKPYPQIKGEPNVVCIMLETFASFKTGVKNDGLDSSPNFDKLRSQGIFFPNFFVPMENTSRSLFNFLFGTPDVFPSRSARNPLVLKQETVVNVFDDYKKMYFIGGNANWANISGALCYNIKDIKIYQEGMYDSPVNDVWGISDEDLFMEANKVLRSIKKGEKFFAFIQTASNHRPFTVPKNARNFKIEKVSEDVLNKNGFYSLKEYNGFRYLDHCLGYFFKLAEKEEYFKNTVFVIQGDHGTMGGSQDSRYGSLSFGSYRVPFLIYAPGFIKHPKEIETIMSELDVLPSLVSFVGKKYTNTTLGKDIFNPKYKNKSFAFTFAIFDADPSYGLVAKDFYVNVYPDGTYKVFKWHNADSTTDVKDQHKKESEYMKNMADAFFEYSKYLVYAKKDENKK
jgi:phosphoglycerol transferase MdoB-like AlkP superfamily enzyme